MSTDIPDPDDDPYAFSNGLMPYDRVTGDDAMCKMCDDDVKYNDQPDPEGQADIYKQAAAEIMHGEPGPRGQIGSPRSLAAPYGKPITPPDPAAIHIADDEPSA